MPADWPFTDPESLAVFTLKRIVRGESSILWVTLDEGDGGWQFLDGGEHSRGGACLQKPCLAIEGRVELWP